MLHNIEQHSITKKLNIIISNIYLFYFYNPSIIYM